MVSLVAKLCPTLATPWTEAHQAPLSMEFPRQEYWSGLPFPSPGGLSDPGIEPGSPALQADYLLTEPQGKPLVRLYNPLIIVLNLVCNILSRVLFFRPKLFFPKKAVLFFFLLIKQN